MSFHNGPLVADLKLDLVGGSIEDGGVAGVVEEAPAAIQFGFHGGDAFHADEPVAGSQLRLKGLGASGFCVGAISVTAKCRRAFVQVQAEIESLFARQFDDGMG